MIPARFLTSTNASDKISLRKDNTFYPAKFASKPSRQCTKNGK
jgi:hypothetical protein